MSQYLASAYWYNVNFNVNGLRTSTMITILNTRTTFSPTNTDFPPDPQSGIGKTLWINAQNGQFLSYPENQSTIIQVSTVITFLTNNRVDPRPIPCFREGTKILCLHNGKEDYVPVEKMRTGTLVKTHLNGYIPIALIGKKQLHNPRHRERIENRLFVCSKEKYPELLEDLYITGHHSILVEELTEEHREKTLEIFSKILITDDKYRLLACLDERAEPFTEPGEYTIYHFALENDNYASNSGVYANGLLVESCSKEYMELHSGLEII